MPQKMQDSAVSPRLNGWNPAASRQSPIPSGAPAGSVPSVEDVEAYIASMPPPEELPEFEIPATVPPAERERILYALAVEGSRSPAVRALAHAIVQARTFELGHPLSPVETLQALLDAVADLVTYEPDPEGTEVFQRVVWTLTPQPGNPASKITGRTRGKGDCEELATLFCAFAMVFGHDARPRWRDQPRAKLNHVLAVTCGLGNAEFSPSGCAWVEATVPGAQIGDTPEVAIARHRASRDVAGVMPVGERVYGGSVAPAGSPTPASTSALTRATRTTKATATMRNDFGKRQPRAMRPFTTPAGSLPTLTVNADPGAVIQVNGPGESNPFLPAPWGPLSVAVGGPYRVTVRRTDGSTETREASLVDDDVFVIDMTTATATPTVRLRIVTNVLRGLNAWVDGTQMTPTYLPGGAGIVEARVTPGVPHNVRLTAVGMADFSQWYTIPGDQQQIAMLTPTSPGVTDEWTGTIGTDGTLAIQVDTPPTGTTATVDGSQVLLVSTATGGLFSRPSGPLQWSGTLPSGTHSVAVSAPGFVTQTRTVTVAAGASRTETFALVAAVVAPRPTTLTVTADGVPDTTIQVQPGNDTFWPVTTWGPHGVPAGTYTITVRAPGRVTAVRTTTIADGDQRTVALTAADMPLATSPIPSNLTVTVDGVPGTTIQVQPGSATFWPVTTWGPHGVPVGTYTVTVRAVGRVDAVRTVTVPPGEDRTVSLTAADMPLVSAAAGTGHLRVDLPTTGTASSIAATTLIVTSQPRGETFPTTRSATSFDADLPAGTYDLIAYAPERTPWTARNVDITAGYGMRLAIVFPPQATGTLTVTSRTDGTLVAIGEAAPVSTPLTTVVPTGAYHIVGSATGRTSWATDVDVRTGLTTNVVIPELALLPGTTPFESATLRFPDLPARSSLTIDGNVAAPTPLVDGGIPSMIVRPGQRDIDVSVTTDGCMSTHVGTILTVVAGATIDVPMSNLIARPLTTCSTRPSTLGIEVVDDVRKYRMIPGPAATCLATLTSYGTARIPIGIVETRRGIVGAPADPTDHAAYAAWTTTWPTDAQQEMCTELARLTAPAAPGMSTGATVAIVVTLAAAAGGGYMLWKRSRKSTSAPRANPKRRHSSR